MGVAHACMQTKTGFKASIYELTARAYLAILLNSVNLEELVMRVNEATALTLLGETIPELQSL